MNKTIIAGILLFLISCNNTDVPETDPTLVPETIAAPAQLSYNIINTYPHDTSAYTQGLQFYNGKLYEGTGDFETSSIRITDIKTGKVEKKHMMGSDKIFGEGITIFKDKIYQLTWTSKIVYVYDIKNIDAPVATFKWPYEGWGITNNGSELIISDGSANLYFVNPDDFKVKSTKQVRDNAGPVLHLNELEYADGFIYANVYQSDYIVKIDPSSGYVTGKIDLPGLLEQYAPKEITPGRTDVLNGIAYDSTNKKFYITGKRWPKLFEIVLN
ncbi:MAG: glutaminyl-peptide cyclotransferase [Chitinophagaceae bacterium]|nr:glutaminyl-peptide cyclotransferase [Chitinophagaceae bacterium]